MIRWNSFFFFLRDFSDVIFMQDRKKKVEGKRDRGNSMVRNKRPAGGSLTQPTNGVDRPMKTDGPIILLLVSCTVIYARV